jgi:aspartokinase-like uncharacterized kinase
MDAVIKIGGSIAESPETLKSLCKELLPIAKKYSVVRDYDKKFSLPPEIAHRLAIIAMDQFGILLAQLIPDSYLCNSLEDAQCFSTITKVPIFLPSKLVLRAASLEASWDVTSDSIAAFIANKINAKKLILVTNVDGIFTSDPKKHSDARLLPEVLIDNLLRRSDRTSVDKFLPKLLLKSQIICYVVNGKHPERLKALLSEEQTIYTLLKL